MIRTSKRPERETGDRLIYDGRRWIGSISPRFGRWRACNTAGRVIGAFDSAAEARRAVVDAAVSDRGGAP